MSMILCDECGALVDTDFVGCEESPTNPQELICGDCYDAINPDKGDGLDNNKTSVDRYGVGALGDGE